MSARCESSSSAMYRLAVFRPTWSMNLTTSTSRSHD